MSSMTVRVHEEAHRTLKELAREAGESMPIVLSKAIEAYRREQFLKGLADDFQALRDNPEAWNEELQERQEWDSTLADDLRED